MLENGLTEKEIKQLSKLKTTQEINWDAIHSWTCTL
jgi:hypothetical protein